MKKIHLYRGITVNDNKTNQVVDNIKQNGLDWAKGSQWGGFIWKDLRENLTHLFEKEDLNREETEPNSIWVKTEKGSHREYTEGNKGICFADKIGANYYAFQHNLTSDHTIPIVIKVEVDINDTAIDGRDFLYTVFANIDRNNVEKNKRQKEKLSKIYGDKICFYIDKVICHPKSDKFAICDLAIIDNFIIRDHLKNEILIKGRHGTRFKSAFYVKTPIHPSKILDIEINKPCNENQHESISLDDVLER